MKVNVRLFDDVLSKIVIGGNVSVNQAKLNFNSDIISGLLRNDNNTVQLRVQIEQKLFDEYESIGEIGIMDLTLFKKMLNRHAGVIDFDITKDKIVFKDKDNVSKIILSDTKFITSMKEYPKVETAEWDEVIKLNASEFKKFISDMSIIDKSEVSVETKKGGMILSSGDMDSITNLIKHKDIKGGCSCMFNDIFMDTIKIFGSNDELTIHLKSNYPMWINLKTDLYNIDYLISPMSTEN